MRLCYHDAMNRLIAFKKRRAFSTLLILCLLTLRWACAEGLDADALNALPDFGAQPVVSDVVQAQTPQPAAAGVEALPVPSGETPYQGLARIASSTWASRKTRSWPYGS